MKYFVLIVILLVSFLSYSQESVGSYDHDLLVSKVHKFQEKTLEVDEFEDQANLRLLTIVSDLSSSITTCPTEKEIEERVIQIQQIENQIELFQISAIEELERLEALNSLYIQNKIHLGVQEFKKQHDLKVLEPKKTFVFCDICQDYTEELIQYFNQKS